MNFWSVRFNCDSSAKMLEFNMNAIPVQLLNENTCFEQDFSGAKDEDKKQHQHHHHGWDEE